MEQRTNCRSTLAAEDRAMIFSLAIKLTPFQWLSIFTLALLIVRELRMVNREPAQIRRKLAQSLVWITAAATAIAPACR